MRVKSIQWLSFNISSATHISIKLVEEHIDNNNTYTDLNKDRLNPLRDGPARGQSFPSEVSIFSVAGESLRLSHWIDLTHTDQNKNCHHALLFPKEWEKSE